jgi:hypothetical protein
MMAEREKKPKTTKRRTRRTDRRSSPPPRVVYTQAPVQLGKLAGLSKEVALVDVGGRVIEAAIDDAVDLHLLAEVVVKRGRVLVEAGTPPCVVGVVQTQRAITVGTDGVVDAEVRQFKVRAKEEVVLQTASAFARIKGGDVELYGERVVTRAREIAKILARMISLN